MHKYLLLKLFFLSFLQTTPLFGSFLCNGFFNPNKQKFVNPKELISYQPSEIIYILKNQYASRQILPANTNKSFINWAKDNELSNFYFDGSFAYIKELNDGIGDKTLVTGLVNYHKMVFLENLFKSVNVSFPTKVEEARPPTFVTGLYSDFKSIKISFNENSPAIENYLKKEMSRANILLAQIARSINLKQNPTLRDNLKSPELWFRAGVGETLDKAGLASIWARKTKEPIRGTIINFFNIEFDLIKLAQRTKNIYSDIIFSMDKKYPNLFSNNHDKVFLKKEVFEVFLKTKTNSKLFGKKLYFHKIALRIEERFGYKLSPYELEKLKVYKDFLAFFIPELLIEKRVQHDLTKDVNYTFVDFSGQNAANFYYSQIAITSTNLKSKNINEIINLSRQAEEISTLELSEGKRYVQEAVRLVYDNSIETVFSGDDGTIYAGGRKKAFVRALSKHYQPSRFRVTWVSKKTSSDKRQELSVTGELIHKDLLLELEQYIDYNVLNKSLIAIDMNYAESNNSVGFFVSGKLSPGEQSSIEALVPKILKTYSYQTGNVYFID